MTSLQKISAEISVLREISLALVTVLEIGESKNSPSVIELIKLSLSGEKDINKRKYMEKFIEDVNWLKTANRISAEAILQSKSMKKN